MKVIKLVVSILAITNEISSSQPQELDTGLFGSPIFVAFLQNSTRLPTNDYIPRSANRRASKGTAKRKRFYLLNPTLSFQKKFYPPEYSIWTQPYLTNQTIAKSLNMSVPFKGLRDNCLRKTQHSIREHIPSIHT